MAPNTCSSLGKLSAGIGNPRACQFVRARRRLRVVLTRTTGTAGQPENNHYAFMSYHDVPMISLSQWQQFLSLSIQLASDP